MQRLLCVVEEARAKICGAGGHPPIHGRYTKAAIETRREVRAILRAVRDLLDLAG